MRIFALKTLRDLSTRHPQAEIPLRGWYSEVSHAENDRIDAATI